jgi:hypothetical protein
MEPDRLLLNTLSENWPLSFSLPLGEITERAAGCESLFQHSASDSAARQRRSTPKFSSHRIVFEQGSIHRCDFSRAAPLAVTRRGG